MVVDTSALVTFPAPLPSTCPYHFCSRVMTSHRRTSRLRRTCGLESLDFRTPSIRRRSAEVVAARRTPGGSISSKGLASVAARRLSVSRSVADPVPWRAAAVGSRWAGRRIPGSAIRTAAPRTRCRVPPHRAGRRTRGRTRCRRWRTTRLRNAPRPAAPAATPRRSAAHRRRGRSGASEPPGRAPGRARAAGE